MLYDVERETLVSPTRQVFVMFVSLKCDHMHTLHTRKVLFYQTHTLTHTVWKHTMTKACLMPFFRMTINTSHNKLYTVLCLCRARLWSSGSDWLNLSSCYKNIQTALCEGVGSLRLTVLQEKFISKALMWICCSSSCSFIDP